MEGSGVDLVWIEQQLRAVDPWVWLVLAAVAVLVLTGLTILLVRRRRRRRLLRRRYGAEYDHTAQRTGSRRRADRDLVAREEERRRYRVRELGSGERDRFGSRWEALQASFVDDPWAAVRGVDELVAEVAVAKGYPHQDGDPLAAASVDHPRSIDRYRLAARAVEGQGVQAGTESLRRTVLAARDVFETMLGTAAAPGADRRSPFGALVDEEQDPPRPPSSPSPRRPDGGQLTREPADRWPRAPTRGPRRTVR